jgi:RimJ/RimL family protein N-acetyltransferase
MTLYTGPDLVRGRVSIGEADPAEVRQAYASSDIPEDFESCLGSAEARNDVLYFSILIDNQLVGQILLHDISLESNSALVAYHMLSQGFRNANVATAALGLLLEYVEAAGILRALTVISESGNEASRRVAEKNGFEYRGSSLEGAGLVVYEWRREGREGIAAGGSA